MEEDIKVLEEFIKGLSHYGTFEKEVQAIENLINRNKELEEETRKPLKVCIGRRNYGKTCEIRTFIEEDYIPKEKVREKIEEYEELVKDFEEYWSKDPRQFKKEKCVDYYKIEALKELLQERDDK